VPQAPADDALPLPTTRSAPVTAAASACGGVHGPRPDRVPAGTLGGLAALLDVDLPGVAGTPCLGVTLDSRAVRPGDLYAGLPGARAHGAGFAEQARAAGAVALLTDPRGADLAAGCGLPLLVVADPRAVLGAVAARVYGEPAADLLMFGVTGTNGKTTTCHLLEAALRTSGRRTGLIGTVETRIADERVPSVRTTPESPDVHALLAVMRERGVQACAMEVSSHALSLHRVDGVRYDVAGFTNLSQDHLDFHPDLAHYFAAKASLFTPERCASAVVCVDDEWGQRLAATATVPLTTVCTPGGVAAAGSHWRAADLVPAGSGPGTDFLLLGPQGERWTLTSPLPGDFNVANTAVAALMLHAAGLGEDQVAAGLAAAAGVPGRMEVVQVPAPGPGTASILAVVDYAHTPDAVAVALGALRRTPSQRLLVVLGAGGDRDAAKRPAMGRAAAEAADVVVVTDDNPRSEDAAAIRAAVLAGARSGAQASAGRGRQVTVLEVADRRQAVLEAVRDASRHPGSVVLVAGKGHESGQDVAGTVHPFDDRLVLRDALQQTAAEQEDR